MGEHQSLEGNLEMSTERIAEGPGFESRTPHRRPRRRLAAWLAFGLFGLMMGITWAAGVATSSATVDLAGATEAATLFGTASSGSGTSQYDGLITADTALEIDLVGKWGSIAADTPMFDIDLSGQTGTFYSEIYLTNTPSGWSVLQIEFLMVAKACADTTAADWAAPDATSVMVFETVDAFAAFDGLASGGSACIGVGATSKANDPNGSFMRYANGATPTAPDFAAILNRSS